MEVLRIRSIAGRTSFVAYRSSPSFEGLCDSMLHTLRTRSGSAIGGSCHILCMLCKLLLLFFLLYSFVCHLAVFSLFHECLQNIRLIFLAIYQSIRPRRLTVLLEMLCSLSQVF